MGRQKIPTKLLVFEGKTHLTKKQIAERMASEVQFGDYNFKPSNIIKTDRVAYSKWKQLIKLFTKPEPLGLISTSDSGLIERYCLTYSEYIKYRRLKISDQEINRKLTLLLQMEKELLLTPAAKIRSAGKNKEQPKQTPLQKAGFGHV